MDNKITSDIPVRYETPQNSGNGVNKVSSGSDNKTVTETANNSVNSTSNVNNTTKIPSAYEAQQKKLTIEAELDSLIKQIMPDLGVQFKIHEATGQIITSVVNNDTREVVREFPAEKMLDIIHSMCQKLGIFVNKKI